MKKRLLVVALTVVFIVSLIGTSVFAATADNVKKYGTIENGKGGYLAIGTSNSRGYGCSGTGKVTKDEQNIRSLRYVENSTVYNVANAVGCDLSGTYLNPNTPGSNFWSLAYPGLTVGLAMDLYGIDDDGYSDTVFDWQYYDIAMEQYGHENSMAYESKYRNRTITYDSSCGKAGNIIDITKNAGLITVELGSADVFYRALRIATNGGSFSEGFNISTENIDELAQTVELMISEMYKGYQHWEKYYPQFLDYLKDNATGEVVVVGAFNVFSDVELTDETVLPIGDIASALTIQMNNKMSKWAEERGFRYADVSNAESYVIQKDYSLTGGFLDDVFIGYHPTPEGHAYIARQILSVLPETTPTTKKSTDIVVDLGRFDSVNYVLVNGRLITNYTMDKVNYTITIPYNKKTATNLTIAVIDSSKKTATVQSYQLIYDNGYTAYRIYGTNDVVKTVSKPVSLVKKAGNWFVGLFKK